ncbi:hypothetical protein H6F77_16595 [Microcoleus sp. FACHB-831]|uniref:hypothetical protein n=1 Tax=Microcoleus sp. FACHB-831 TaxID=2692827 RepID=UPI001683B1DE|nr:hypothetical protein [Microcoleus sp. FACHB-831]MBD1922682.1 hypothetical protein [Microcoleus sp. FACHB-831]
MTLVTPEEIAKFRTELADYPDALAALDVIEQCDGNLESAAEVIVIDAGGEIVRKPDWLDELAEQLREVVCKDEFRNGMMNDSVNVAIAYLLASSPFSPELLVIPVFMYILRKGINKFCTDAKLQ